MGIVYKARQETLNRIVALKTVIQGALATPKETLNDPQVRPNGYVVPNLDDQGVEYQIVDFDAVDYFDGPQQ